MTTSAPTPDEEPRPDLSARAHGRLFQSNERALVDGRWAEDWNSAEDSAHDAKPHTLDDCRAAVLETVVVGPGDRLVAVVPKNTTMAEMEHWRAVLNDNGWSDRVLIVAGVEQLAVLRGEHGDGDEAVGDE